MGPAQVFVPVTSPGQPCADDNSIFGTWKCLEGDGSVEIYATTPGAFDEETGILRFKKFTECRTPDGKVIKEEIERIKHYATLEHIHT